MAKIELKNVSKFFGETIAVNNVSFTVPNGQFLALVGPSGCGKSTLLRMISGLETTDEGKIIIDGVQINDKAPKDRDIAMVFQNYALYPHMSVYKNLAFGLKMRGMSKVEIDKQVKEVSKLLNIEELLDRKPKQLSGGQKQRIAVGRAIVRKPKAFLFDEPLSNLDAKLRVKMRTDLLKLHKKQNATSIYVTHDQIEAMTMADQIAIIDKGVIQQVDTPMNVYKNPNNLFVATFIGSPSMNFLHGKITEGESGYQFESQSSNTAINLTNEMVKRIPEKSLKNLTLGIRPEDTSLTKTDGAVPLKPAKVDLVEHMGDISMIHVSPEERVEWTLKTPPVENIEINDLVTPYLQSNKIHIFDGKMGVNLLK
jgi:multiple sugar transport system ATP-binding protein